MPLKDTHVRNAKPTGKAYKISDGDGMYLLVVPSGSRYWRLDYRFAGKRRTHALGTYPEVSLARARRKREKAREQLATVSIRGKQKRRRNVWRSWRKITHLWLSQGSGSATSAIDWLLDIVR